MPSMKEIPSHPKGDLRRMPAVLGTIQDAGGATLAIEFSRSDG